MKKCDKDAFDLIRINYHQEHLDINGVFSRPQQMLFLTMREEEFAVVAPHARLLVTLDGIMLPLNHPVKVIGDRCSKPFWEVYAVFNPIANKYFYNPDVALVQSTLKGESWNQPYNYRRMLAYIREQKQEGARLATLSR